MATNFSSLITDAEFDNDVTFPHYLRASNPADVQRWINENDDIDLTVIQSALNDHKSMTAAISKEDVKAVFAMLKDRKINPKGEFDKQGRFYLDDSELVDVRAPSTKYPYSQMNAGRTSKFVKAVAEKYKCMNRSDLELCFAIRQGDLVQI